MRPTDTTDATDSENSNSESEKDDDLKESTYDSEEEFKEEFVLLLKND